MAEIEYDSKIDHVLFRFGLRICRLHLRIVESDNPLSKGLLVYCICVYHFFLLCKSVYIFDTPANQSHIFFWFSFKTNLRPSFWFLCKQKLCLSFWLLHIPNLCVPFNSLINYTCFYLFIFRQNSALNNLEKIDNKPNKNKIKSFNFFYLIIFRFLSGIIGVCWY